MLMVWRVENKMNNVVDLGDVFLNMSLFALGALCLLLFAVFCDMIRNHRRNKKNRAYCPKCNSHKITRWIDVSRRKEHYECMDCGHSFPLDKEPAIIIFCEGDEND